MVDTISKSQLKAKMYEVFRSIEASGDELIVTDRGKPVLKIVPVIEKGTVAELFGDIQGRVIYHEDIDTPIIDEWVGG
jgi:antitoxin (DNA-binding transcriptional repressor) of toxin-antitoxin stability system